MRKGMKQVLAALLALTMLFGVVGAFAEEDTEISSDELFNQMDEEADQTEDVSLDENMDTDTNELTEEEKAALEALDHAEGGVTIDNSQLEINTNLPTNVFNILLLGIDARQDVNDLGRSDAMMICSINTDDGSIKLTSIQRDLLVTMPTKQNPYKITNAYRWGGAQMSMPR